MRPVRRGPWPKQGRTRITFGEYDEAREPLIQRIGAYCSYCEMPHPTPAVEHILGKKAHPAMRLSWTNFLLTCWSCNSVKGSRATSISDYYWPDRDNTARVFEIERGGRIRLSGTLSTKQIKIASKTMELTGFHRDPSSIPPATKHDRRWRQRLVAWRTAEHCRVLYSQNSTTEMRTMVRLAAIATGFWSIWMTVFARIPEVRRDLVIAFPGTARDCFRNGAPTRRKRGRI